MGTGLRITVVIPTFAEVENLPKLVSALFSLPLNLKAIIVDDNSPDGTGRVADSLAEAHPDRLRVIHRLGKLGLRTAYLSGFKEALDMDSEVIGQMDADFSHDPSALVGMAAQLPAYDAVFGSRYVAGGRVDECWPVWRKVLSAFGNYYARTILDLPLRDVTTGFRLWRRESLLRMPLERISSSGYVFLVEMAYLAHCLDYHLFEYPIHFQDRQWGRSKMSPYIQMEAAVHVWRVRWSYRDLRRRKPIPQG